jgi:hypothetical protein
MQFSSAFRLPSRVAQVSIGIFPLDAAGLRLESSMTQITADRVGTDGSYVTPNAVASDWTGFPQKFGYPDK